MVSCVDDVSKRLSELGRVANPSNETGPVQELTEAVKQHLTGLWAKQTADSRGRPILRLYSSDCTPLTVRKTRNVVASAGKMRRTGKTCEEFLVQFLYSRCPSLCAQDRDVILLADPVMLQHGKTGSALFEVGKSFAGAMVPDGVEHGSICVHHTMFDRACWGQLSKAFANLAEQQWERSMSGHVMSEDEKQIMSDKLWTTSTPCALHDVHNAFKWCVSVFYGKKDYYRDTFVCASSCRNIALECLEVLGGWLPTVVQCVGSHTCNVPSKEVQRQFWSSLGCSDDIVTSLVDDLGVWWDHGVFIMTEEVVVSGEYMEPLSKVLHEVFAFRTFSASRWGSVGTACRCLVRALRLGWSSLVDYALACKQISEYDANGFKRMNIEVWEFVHVCALVSDVSERLLFELMADPRLPRALSNLRHVLDESVLTLHEHHFQFWNCFCTQTGLEALQLRHKVLQAAAIALTYVEEKTFKHAGMRPWNLLEGSIADNLSEFLEQDITDEPSIAHSIKRLATSPIHRNTVIEALGLLADVPWTTLLVEQLHGATSLVRRHHADYGCDMLQCRSFLYTVSKLLGSPTQMEKRKHRLQARLSHLVNKQPTKISGRHMYFREGVRRARIQHATGTGKFNKASYSRSVMRKHGAWWAEMDLERKEQYHHLAEQERVRQVELYGNAMTAEMESLRCIELHLAEETSKKGVVSLGCCRFVQADFHSIFDHVETIRQQKARARLRRAAATCPKPLPKKDFLEVQNRGLRRLREVQAPCMPVWSKVIARNRLAFTDSILHVVRPGHSTLAYKFLYAVEKPLLAFWLELEELVMSCTDDRFTSLSLEQLTLLPIAMYRVVSWCAVESASIRVEGSVMTVSMDSMWLAHEQIAVYGAAVTLKDLALEFPEESHSSTRPETSDQPRASSDPPPAHNLVQFPWMRGLLAAVEGQQALPQGAGPVTDDSVHVAANPEEDSHLPDESHGETEHNGEAIEDMFRELAQEQSVFKDSAQIDDSCFTLSLLGEARKMQRTGAAVAGIKASIRAGTTCEKWARSYNLQQGTRFEVSKYTQVYATKLARAWIHRMSFLYTLYCNSTSDEPYTEANLETYVVTQDLQNCLDNLTGAARNRAIAVRDMRPR
eukprot:492907-Amphidinium_carterae.1